MNDEADLGRLRALVMAASPPSTCPTADTLARAAAGELNASERRAVADHMMTCASCSEEYRVAASLAEWAERTSGEIQLPGHGRRPLAAARWPVLAAAAAAIIAVGATATIVVWALSLRAENARLTAALDDSAHGAAARSAETDSREKTQATTIADLQARLADTQVPTLNVPIIDLLPRDASRGAASQPIHAQVPAGAREVAFVITTPSDPIQRDHELEIIDASGAVVWRGGGLRPSAEGTFTVTVPRSLLPAGTCRLRLHASANNGSRLVAEYVVDVEP